MSRSSFEIVLNTHTHTHIDTHTYTRRERERERDGGDYRPRSNRFFLLLHR